MKTKIILKSNTIVFDPFNLFVFVNIFLLVLFKKFNGYHGKNGVFSDYAERN